MCLFILSLSIRHSRALSDCSLSSLSLSLSRSLSLSHTHTHTARSYVCLWCSWMATVSRVAELEKALDSIAYELRYAPSHHCLSVCLSASLPQSAYLSVYLSAYLSVYHSAYLSVYLSAYLSVYHSAYLSVYLSVCVGWSVCLVRVTGVLPLPLCYSASMSVGNALIRCLRRTHRASRSRLLW